MKNFILILCLATFSQWVYAQNKQISGRVVDTKGEAAIGASTDSYKHLKLPTTESL